MILLLSTKLIPRRSRRDWISKPRSTCTTFLPRSAVVARVAIACFSTTTVPVISWVNHHRNVSPRGLRNNYLTIDYGRYKTASLEPSVRARDCDPFVTVKTRWHMSTGREIQTSSAKEPSLTSEMLSLRFRDVFAHFRSLRPTSKDNRDEQPATIEIPDESIIRMNLLRTRHGNLELDKCRIDVSTIPDAGYGVYATTTIQRNEFITLYPGDAIIQWKHKDHLDPATDGGIQIFFGTHIPESERTAAALDNNNFHCKNSSDDSKHRIFMNHIPSARGYEVRVNDTISVIGDPNRKSDSAYLGHMINDYCTIQGNNTQTEEEIIRQYNIQSIQKSNCKIQVGIDQCHVEIVATRDIASDEELFLSYGSNYWLSRRIVTESTSSDPVPLEQGTTGVHDSTPPSNRITGFGNSVDGGKVKTKRK